MLPSNLKSYSNGIFLRYIALLSPSQVSNKSLHLELNRSNKVPARGQLVSFWDICLFPSLVCYQNPTWPALGVDTENRKNESEYLGIPRNIFLSRRGVMIRIFVCCLCSRRSFWKRVIRNTGFTLCHRVSPWFGNLVNGCRSHGCYPSR